jgi:hypothetical protein
MIDEDLKVQLEQLNQNLIEIKNKKSGGVWHAFFNGMFGALGYVVGLAIVVLLLGWFLQKNGLLEAFERQVTSFANLISSAEKLIPSNQQNSDTTTSPQSMNTGGQPATVILPGGQQVKVSIPSGQSN